MEAAPLEVLGELCRRRGTVSGKRRHQIRHVPDLDEGDGLDLGVVAGEPPGRGALVALTITTHDQAQAERVLQGDVIELAGCFDGEEGVPGLEGAPELRVGMSLGRHGDRTYVRIMSAVPSRSFGCVRGDPIPPEHGRVAHPGCEPDWFDRYVSLGWGRTVFEAQPEPVVWSAAILHELTAIEPGLSEVDAILACAADSALWPSGHDRFRVARCRSIADQPSEAVVTPRTMLLVRGELVAKIGYNATDPPNPFDGDTGWWIAPSATRIAAYLGDADLAVRVAVAIHGWTTDIP